MLETFVRECGDRPPDGVLALRWLNRRYRQVWSAANWPFAQKSAILTTVAKITTGDVDLTNGSATVTEGTSGANGWTSVIDGRKFRRTGDNEYYNISGYSNDNPDTFSLDRVYEGTTGSDLGYTIFQNIYSLTTDMGALHNVVSLNDRFSLTEMSREEMDTAFPNRPNVNEPRFFTISGRDSNDIYQVELEPAPKDAEGYTYWYTQEAPYIVGGNAKIVPQIFESLLEHGWMANYWRWRAKMEDANGTELNHARDEEQFFSKELQETAMREFRNEPPKRVKMAGIYTAHRRIRGDKFGITDRRSQMPNSG